MFNVFRKRPSTGPFRRDDSCKGPKGRMSLGSVASPKPFYLQEYCLTSHTFTKYFKIFCIVWITKGKDQRTFKMNTFIVSYISYIGFQYYAKPNTVLVADVSFMSGELL